MSGRRLAVLGLGGVGSGMARRLLETGHRPTVYNRSAAKAEPLRAAGATVAESAADAARDAEVVILSLSDEEAVEEVLFGSVLPMLKPGAIVLDGTTVAPSYARDAAKRLASTGVARLEFCVIGNPEMARNGELRVFLAGDESAVGSVRDLVRDLSRHGALYLGPTGRASVLKLAFNLLLGVQTAGLAEAVRFVEQAGLGREQLLTAIMKSGWRSPVLNFRAEFMRKRSYDPAGFRAGLMAKDLRLADDEATAGGLDLPIVRCARRRFEQTVAGGMENKDAAVVVELTAG